MNLVTRSNTVYTVRVETKEEKVEFEKDWNDYQKTRNMYETAIKAEQAADIKIANAQARIETGERNITNAEARIKAADITISNNVAIASKAREERVAAEEKIKIAGEKIKIADENIKNCDIELQKAHELREKKRALIVVKLDNANTLLTNKVNFVLSLNGKPEKEAWLTELNNLISKTSELKNETLTSRSVEAIVKKLHTFSQEISNIFTKIG